MADDREIRIRDHAYRLWQQDGEPHGRDRDHWEQAERDIGGDPGDIDADASVAAPAVGEDAADAPSPAPEPEPAVASDEPDAPAAPVAATPPVAQPTPTAPPAATKSPAKKPVSRRKRST